MSPGDRRPPDDEDDGVSTADRTSSSETDETAANGGDRRSTERLRGDNAAERDIPTRTGSTESDSLWTQFRTANDGPLLLLREVLLSGGIVLLFGLLLFGASGVWPPMVAVESESMEPNINQYDLILVSEPGRFAPEMADRTGVVTANSVAETEHKSFNREGSVVVYQNPESLGPPIIHRTHFYVEDGENWYDRANPEYIAADSCSELDQCPAPHAGYITKGDNSESNSQYDQANGIAPVVKPGWVTGIAHLRIPRVGYIRLALTGAASFGPLLPAGVGAVGAGTAYAIGRRELLT
jgi:signal peptidase